MSELRPATPTYCFFSYVRTVRLSSCPRLKMSFRLGDLETPSCFWQYLHIFVGVRIDLASYLSFS